MTGEPPTLPCTTASTPATQSSPTPGTQLTRPSTGAAPAATEPESGGQPHEHRQPARGDWILGITIRQPYATCILAVKNPENKPRPWLWRCWVLIHAGQKLERPALRDPLIATAIRGRELHLGAVIGVARLTGCHPDQGPICGADRPRRLLLTGGPRGQGARGAVRVP
jgi:hypothetical protein